MTQDVQITWDFHFTRDGNNSLDECDKSCKRCDCRGPGQGFQAGTALYQTHPLAERFWHTAKAVLVFPNVVKAGLVFGGSYGEGELMKGTTIIDYYNTVSGSWGLQAGAQSYGYAICLMTDKAVTCLEESKGWEIGVGPTVVVVDEGAAKVTKIER